MRCCLIILETPQYLRKQLFKIEPRLAVCRNFATVSYASSSCKRQNPYLKAGEYREGAVLAEDKEGLLMDIGVEQPALLRETEYGVGDRLTLQVVNVGKRIYVQAVNREGVPAYWGFRVRVEKRSFCEFVC